MNNIAITDKNIRSLQAENRKYLRALREIHMTDIRNYTSYKEQVEDIKKIAIEATGQFRISKWGD